MNRLKQSWASEGFFPGGGAVGDFPEFFQRGAKSGEICFLPLKKKIEKTKTKNLVFTPQKKIWEQKLRKQIFFANNFKIQGAQGPAYRRPCNQYRDLLIGNQQRDMFLCLIV